MKTSSEDEDERRLEDVFIKTNVCWDTPKSFHGGQIVDQIQKWQKLTSAKFILQMLTGDTIEFENDSPIKHNAKIPNPTYLE